MRLRRFLRAAQAALWLGAAGCNALAGITEGEPRTGLPCSTDADCIVEEPECRAEPRCEGGRCAYEDVTEGTVVSISRQTPGDCAQLVCNGAGGLKLVPASSDTADDGDPCTLDECDGTKPVHTLAVELSCYSGPPGAQGVGICKAGVQRCDEQGNPLGGCQGETLPGTETCLSPQDEDCDGQINEEGEGCVCLPGEIVHCYSGPAGTDGVGICHGSTAICREDGLGPVDCVGEQPPEAETCLGGLVDEDCDGAVNEEGDGCYCGDGWVSTGEQCDDQNQEENDSCTNLCQLTACGDGSLQWGESCDDGNTTDGDGCPADCVRPVTAIDAGDYHTCAILGDGRVKCWGSNGGGQLGLGDVQVRGDQPGEMSDNLPFVDLAASEVSALAGGFVHTCALLVDGKVQCWGANFYGQLGLGDLEARGDAPGEMGGALPTVDLGAGQVAVAIAAGSEHTCALTSVGAVKCWGLNYLGQLGLGDTQHRGDGPGEMGDNLPPVDLGAGQVAVAISAGSDHTCALLNGGSVKCWGNNYEGQLGLGDTNIRGGQPGEMGANLPAVDLGPGAVATAIAAGNYHTCALLDDGSVKCWGNNYYGQLGLGDTQPRGDQPGEMGANLPAVDLGVGVTATAIAGAYRHTCALLSNGSVKCWGANVRGELGLGDTQSRGNSAGEMGANLPAVDLGAGATVTAITAGYEHTCARLGDGHVKCWGRNDYAGELGLGDLINRGDSPSTMGDNLVPVAL